MIFHFSSCQTIQDKAFTRFYKAYIAQDHQLMKDVYESGDIQNSTQLEVARLFYVSSVDEYVYEHNIQDSTSLWFRIFEAKKEYFNARISKAIQLLEDDFINIRQYSLPEQIELSDIYQQANSKYHTEDATLDIYLKLAASLNSNDLLEQYLSALNCIHVANTIRNAGRYNEAEGFVYIATQWNIDQGEFPIIKAKALSTLTPIQLTEENKLVKSTFLKNLKHCETYPILKPIYLNVLCAYTTIMSKEILEQKRTFEESMRLIDMVDSIGTYFPLFKVYNRTSQVYKLWWAGYNHEALNVLYEIDKSKVLDSCSVLESNIRIIEGSIVAVEYNDYSQLQSIIQSPCIEKGFKIRAAFQLAQSFQGVPDSVIHYANLVETYSSELHSANDQFHYSDILYGSAELKLPAFFDLSKEDNANKYNFINTIVDSKSRSNRKINQTVQNRQSSLDDNLRMFILTNEKDENSPYQDVYRELINQNYSNQNRNFVAYANADPRLIRQVQSKLGQDQALIEYFLGRDRSWYYLLKKDTLIINELDTSQLVSSINRTLTDIIARNNIDTIKEGLEFLYNRLLPGEISKQYNSLYIIPDKLLQVFPFHALRSDGDYIAAHKKLYYPVSLLSFLQKDPEISDIQSILYLAFSDEHTVKSLEVSPVTELQYFEEEWIQLKEFWKDIPISSFTGYDMTVSNLTNSIANHDLIYISSHSQSNSEIKLDNYIYFREDGKPVKWYPINLHADLTDKVFFLSSCKSGIGNIQNGESVQSIANTLLEKNAKLVVETLWEINEKNHDMNVLGPTAQSYTPQENDQPYFWAGVKCVY